jgi:hypothetical protein
VEGEASLPAERFVWQRSHPHSFKSFHSLLNNLRLQSGWPAFICPPAACSSRRKSRYARRRLRSAFKGPVRGMDDGPNSFVDNDACRAHGKEQRGNEENKNCACGAFENWVHGVTFRVIACFRRRSGSDPHGSAASAESNLLGTGAAGAVAGCGNGQRNVLCPQLPQSPLRPSMNSDRRPLLLGGLVENKLLG